MSLAFVALLPLIAGATTSGMSSAASAGIDAPAATAPTPTAITAPSSTAVPGSPAAATPTAAQAGGPDLTPAPPSAEADALAPQPTRTLPPSEQAPWPALYRGTRFGLGLDVGAPAGAGLLGIVRPWSWFRTNAGLAYDVLGFGVRGGVSFVPWHFAVTPTFNLDFGHYFSGDASMFVSNPTPTQKTLLQQATFDFVSPQIGLEFGSQQRFTFYLRGGLTYIGNMSFAGKDVTAEAQAHTGTGNGTWTSSGDLAFRGLLPSFSFGFILFVD